MKKLALSLCLFFVFPICAQEAEKTEDVVFVRPFVEKISKQLAMAVPQANSEALTCNQEDSSKNLPSLVTMHVGCNIPSSGQIVSSEGNRSISLAAYIQEFANTIAPHGSAVITAPASHDVVFTDGTCSYEEIYSQIDEELAKIGENKDAVAIKNSLSQLKGINRASFVRRENKLILVTDARALRVGESMWRITPQGVEQDIYHSEEEYLVAFRNAGLVCEEISRPSFFGEIKWKMYNESLKDKKDNLGAAYIDHNPFTIFHVKKTS